MMTGYQVITCSQPSSPLLTRSGAGMYSTLFKAPIEHFYLVFGESCSMMESPSMYQGSKCSSPPSRNLKEIIERWHHSWTSLLSFIKASVRNPHWFYNWTPLPLHRHNFNREVRLSPASAQHILFAALAYLVAIMFGFSGILSLIAFGLTQQRYTFRNITIHHCGQDQERCA